MCTLIVAHGLSTTAPIVVGANRDESLERPASPPAVVERGDRRIFAPRDERAGGTWLGINDTGLFAGLTNRFGPATDPDRDSRGELVFRALEHDSARAAASALGELDATRYNAFHLVIADRDEVDFVVSDGRRCNAAPASSDLVVVTERSFGAADDPRKEVALDALRAARDDGRLELDDLGDILSRCEPDSLEALCIDLGEIDYGTRSSTLVSLADDSVEFHHAEGPPCEVEYDDLSDEASRLLE